jgi:hypothetical protein
MDNVYLESHTKGKSGGLGILQKNAIATYQEHLMPAYAGGGRNLDIDWLLSEPVFQDGGKKKKTKKRSKARKSKKSVKRLKSFIKNNVIAGGISSRKSKKSRKSSRASR